MSEPIPFLGWLKLDDVEDTVIMLREQLEIQQAEILRLTTEVAYAYKKGWDAAIDASIEKLFNTTKEKDDD